MIDITKFDSDELMALARLDLKNENLGEALYKLKAVLIADKTIESIQITAQIYAQLGLFEKAENLFKECLDDDSSENTRFQLGMTIFDQNKLDEALEMWLPILDTNELHPPALFYCGLASLQKGDEDKAISYLQTIIENVNTENLYFSQSRDLLKNIKSKNGATSDDASDAMSKVMNTDAYKTVQ